MTRIRRILHPSDFSPASRAALTKAIELARSNRAELLLLHVLAPVMPAMGVEYVSPRVIEDLMRATRSEAERHLTTLAARAKKAGVRVATLVVEGTPFTLIAKTAKAKRADLIVVGTHGRSGLSKLFLGSVAERVVGTAPCPVLTVRGTSGRR